MTVAAEPIVNVMRDGPLAAGWAVDVAEIDRKLEELFTIALIEHLLRVDVHCITMAGSFRGRGRCRLAPASGGEYIV